MVFVGARSITEDRVFCLRAFQPDREQDARDMYLKFSAVYGGAPSEVELLFGTYPSPDAFFRAEPTWKAQFPPAGDATFANNGIGV